MVEIVFNMGFLYMNREVSLVVEFIEIKFGKIFDGFVLSYQILCIELIFFVEGDLIVVL